MADIDTALIPLGATTAWITTVHAAGYVCQCEQRCGATHPRTGGRCRSELTEHSTVRLYVIPAQPTSETLIALCGTCLDKREKAARKADDDAARALADEAPSLFDLIA